MDEDKTREKEIKDFISKLQKLWIQHPNQRFFQLLFNYTHLGTRAGIGIIRDPFHYDDDDVLKDIEEKIKNDT